MKDIGSPRRIREDNIKIVLNKRYILMYTGFIRIRTGSSRRRGVCEQSH
jgi:hypothetical protein